MALEIKLNQKLSQSLVMTPQLQQAIKLLQLGRLEYAEVIQKELLENPVLEDARESDSDDDNKGEQATTDGSHSETPEGNTESAVLSGEEAVEAQPNADGENPFLSNDVDWSQYFESTPDFGYISRNAAAQYAETEERPSIEATVSQPEGLSSHLLWQLRTSDLTPEDGDIAVQIIGNIDRNGYLECSTEEMASLCECDVADIERVLGVIQSLDPAGIAARDLRECLLIQLGQQGMEGSLVWQIVANHLEKLELRKYDVVAKEEKVSVEEIYEAIKLIQTLEPRPGRPFVDESPVYITPDIYVRKVGDEYVVSLNEAGVPKLRVNSAYRDLLMNGSLPEDAPNKEYLQDRLRSAAWLIKSIHQRQQTIYRVTESIVKHQREFLDKGISALKPLVLRDIAEDVGMHESTVSRVTTNKYVHTPQGVFELKFFFTSGLRTGGGEISSESVKEMIRTFISAEDPRKPLSDQALVDMLKQEGIDIARRTVAKYREMMGILSSSRRKKLF